MDNVQDVFQETPQDVFRPPPMWRVFLREHWLHLLIVAVLIVLPHAIGWITGDSPFGRVRGSRVIMAGESTYWQAIFIEMFSLAVLVMSYNLMFGFTGVISFGHALFFGIGGYAVGIVVQYWDVDPNLAFIAGVLLVIFITSILGLLIGLLSLRLRGIYFAIFTLAIAEMAWLYAGSWRLTRGEDGLTINRLPEWIDPERSRLMVYYIGLALFVTAFLVIRRLVRSPAGAVFQAIRENEDRAKAIGYNTLRYKLLSIVVASVLAGLAGILMGILNKSARPELLGVTYTVDALLITIIGGVGTLAGPVVGTAGLHLLELWVRDSSIILSLNLGLFEFTLNFSQDWILIIGVVFVVVVLVFPYGLVGTWYRLRARVGDWWERRRATT
ncbi:MAG: branched-chain amino acid ABC transporter permease [Anaerolineaceae bacterium]|nr:MAG: branched-chain amino acid ABC transporter permease [Anaerolineaceae bacterium]